MLTPEQKGKRMTLAEASALFHALVTIQLSFWFLKDNDSQKLRKSLQKWWEHCENKYFIFTHLHGHIYQKKINSCSTVFTNLLPYFRGYRRHQTWGIIWVVESTKNIFVYLQTFHK
jgi:hypothetical protein